MFDPNSDEITEVVKGKRRGLSIVSLLLVVVFTSLIPVVLVKKTPLALAFLDIKGPLLTSLAPYPRGLGISPVLFSFDVDDAGAGVAEVSMTVEQRSLRKEFFRKTFAGDHSARASAALDPASVGLKEGAARIVIRTIDKSRWANVTEIVLSLGVDLGRPHIESYPEESAYVTEGSAYLVFYKAQDAGLVATGVRVGNNVFSGFPAREVDADLQDNRLYACVYAIPLNTKADSPRIYAEDAAGNTSSVSLNRRVTKRPTKTVTHFLSEYYVRDRLPQVISANVSNIERAAQAASIALPPLATAKGPDTLLQWLSFFGNRARQEDSQEINEKAKGLTYEHNHLASFLRPQGDIRSGFGEIGAYTWNGREIVSYLQTGYEITGSRDVSVAQDGMAVLLGTFGWYGRVLVVDHGLGMQTMYAGLEKFNVLRGESVKKGQTVAEAGSSGALLQSGYYVEMRVQQVPVDAQDWWTNGSASVEAARKVEAVRRAENLPGARQ